MILYSHYANRKQTELRVGLFGRRSSGNFGASRTNEYGANFRLRNGRTLRARTKSDTKSCVLSGSRCSFSCRRNADERNGHRCFFAPYEGVVAADTGHIAVHEAGAIEAGGHKVLSLAGAAGKISDEMLKRYLLDFYADENRAHTVQPGMVYISQPTECGTLYSKKELSKIAAVCREYALALYIDGTRLAYALSSPENDVTLSDLASLSDAFYIGGTKCGALFGEALVIPDKNRLPHFITTIKQHGTLLAKGRLLGVQFETLFEDSLYFRIGDNAIRAADKIRSFLNAQGFRQYFASPTNRIFIVLKNEEYARLSEKIDLSFWEKADEAHSVVRIATSWATTDEQVERLLKVLSEHSPCGKS